MREATSVFLELEAWARVLQLCNAAMSPIREKTFRERFGRGPEIVADAPGRVNLIGEHTDYNGGYVLPVAIPERARVLLAKRTDRMVNVAGSGFPDGRTASYELGQERAHHAWTDSIVGVTVALHDRGIEVGGFDVLISSDVPVGAGLASNAATEVAVVRALRSAFELPLDDVDVARVAYEAETRFVGVPEGRTGAMAASLADERTALFLDVRTGAHERIPIPREMDLLVVDSGISHDALSGAYATRRRECERAAELLGVPSLRDIGEEALSRIDELPPPYDRRVRHFVDEQKRVLAAIVALKTGDVASLGRLFDESQASLRDNLEVSLPPVDALCEIARSSGCKGAHITGGGFGGAIVAVTEAGRAESIGAVAVSTFARLGYGRANVVVGGPAEEPVPPTLDPLRVHLSH